MHRTTKMETLQRFYLLLGVILFSVVIYFSALEKVTLTIPTFEVLSKKPNFIFILTDDQDIVLDGMRPMVQLEKLVKKKGVSFSHAYVASPLCCPSRSSILTGQYVHNHGVINNSLSGQCSSSQWQNGPEKRTFITHFRKYGYSTFYAGKYLNQYGDNEVGNTSHVPPGWNWWIGLKGNSRYYNYTVSINGTKVKHKDDPKTDYFTTVIHKYALQFLESRPRDNPFFMMLATPAAHAPFTPIPEYKNKYSNLNAPRTKNFNIKNSKDKHWLLRVGEQPLSNQTVGKIDEVYRNRLRTLLSVDDMIKDLVYYLNVQNLIEDTYIIFTSDNGYHLGQFSLPLDKREPYEFDSKVPLIIKGPMIPFDKSSSYLTSNIDLAPTFLDLANIPIPGNMDGISLKSILVSPTIIKNKDNVLDNTQSIIGSEKRKSILIEHTGEGGRLSKGCEFMGVNTSGCNVEFSCKCEDSFNNTYSCIRQFYGESNSIFCAWKDDENFQEMYNLNNDTNQLHNLIPHLTSEQRQSYVESLEQLVKCKEKECSR